MPTEKRQQWAPGPWTFHRTHRASADAWFVIVDPNGSGPIVDVGGDEMSGQIAEAKYLITDPNIIEANARLIAQSVMQYRQAYGRQVGHVTRLATPEEVAIAQAKASAEAAERARRIERESRQDWKDASYIAGALDHSREHAIAAIGAGLLAEIATLLRDKDEPADPEADDLEADRIASNRQAEVDLSDRTRQDPKKGGS